MKSIVKKLDQNTNPVVLVGVIEMQKEIIDNLKEQIYSQQRVIERLSDAVASVPKVNFHNINGINADNGSTVGL